MGDQWVAKWIRGPARVWLIVIVLSTRNSLVACNHQFLVCLPPPSLPGPFLVPAGANNGIAALSGTGTATATVKALEH